MIQSLNKKQKNYQITQFISQSEEQNKIKLRIIVSLEQITKSYIAEITQQQLNKCSFDNFFDLKDYIAQSQQNYDINVEQNYLSIVTVTSLRGKQNKIQLFRINICEVATNDRNLLTALIKRCQKNGELTNNQIKQFFVKIINYLAQNKSNSNNETSDEIFDTIVNKIAVSGQNTQNLKTQVITIDQKIEKVIQNFNLISLQIKESLRQMDKKLSRQTIQLKKIIQNQAQKFGRETINLNQKFNNLNEKCKLNNKNLQNQVDKIDDQLKVLTQISTAQYQKIQKTTINQMIQIKQKNIQDYFSVASQQINNYGMNGMNIIKTQIGKVNSGIIGRIPIAQKNSFVIKIIFTRAWGITVGIKDLLTNQIIKYGGNGWISNCNATVLGQGKGLNNGDILQVNIDLQKGQIIWKVQNKQTNYTYETKCLNDKIKDKQKYWVPFICMSNEGDQIQHI